MEYPNPVFVVEIGDATGVHWREWFTVRGRRGGGAEGRGGSELARPGEAALLALGRGVARGGGAAAQRRRAQRLLAARLGARPLLARASARTRHLRTARLSLSLLQVANIRQHHIPTS